jgi:hypothetical protein
MVDWHGTTLNCVFQQSSAVVGQRCQEEYIVNVEGLHARRVQKWHARPENGLEEKLKVL